MKASLFYLPGVGSREDVERGMAGLRPELYQEMLRDLAAEAKLGDELGYDSISFTEHHFHVEGFELSNNPVLLDLYIAMQTRNIRVGQLGIVLPAQNPIRVAEDIAMLDHMSGGRANAGFARGYQRRWVDTMAQHLHGIHGATPGQHDAIDQANRAAFEEHFRIIKAAWTEDMLNYEGKYWSIPVHGTPWDIDATRKWGAGLGDDNVVQALGVVPKPLQKPHPPIFQPFASSENTIRWCAREDVTAILPTMNVGLQNRLYEVYRDEAAANGKALKPGRGLAVLRDLIICDTDEEAVHWWRHGAAFCGAAWFAPFHFGDVLRGADGAAPTPEQMLADGSVLVGTVNTVRRQMERLVEQTPVEWIFAWMYSGLIPNAVNMKSIELFKTRVLPAFE
ncbi:MAG TPA: LLM class flavin-dependent oxidoreductase [Tepidiformaceae bacterium]|nr:LLM class flavin-dependent oxidoreductase [Tepidiformaceae bacterium]